MTDIDNLIDRVTTLSEQWTELDAELTGKLREFASWMREKFPITTTPSQWKYNPPIRLVPAAHNLYPTPRPQNTSWLELSIEEPIDKDGFFFTDSDGDGWHLPLAWLRGPEEFFQALLTQAHAAEREEEAREANLRTKEADRLRARLAELEAQ